MATPLSLPRARREATERAQDGSTQAVSWNLVGSWLISAAIVIFAIGGAWDIQWHIAVGRDRALTPPHLMILLGIALAGLTSVIWVLGNTWQARRDGTATARGRIFGLFSTPIGFVVAGFGALLGTIAFPLDDYWHTLYGIDVTLWAPFHVMIISSMVLAGLGSLSVIAVELRRVTDRHRLTAQVSFAASLAATIATLMIFLVQADTREGLAQIGGYTFVLYPILLALALPLAVVPAVTVTKLPGAATIGALVFLAMRQSMFWFVPWAVDTTVAYEGLAYRTTESLPIVTPFAYPTAILAAALVVDLAYWIMRRRKSTNRRMLLGAAWIAAVGATFWDRPWATTLPTWYFADLNVQAVFAAALPFTLIAALLGVGMAVLISRALDAVAYEGANHA
jgi:hypothetical protein